MQILDLHTYPVCHSVPLIVVYPIAGTRVVIVVVVDNNKVLAVPADIVDAGRGECNFAGVVALSHARGMAVDGKVHAESRNGRTLEHIRAIFPQTHVNEVGR
jgi:hypothetical protein